MFHGAAKTPARAWRLLSEYLAPAVLHPEPAPWRPGIVRQVLRSPRVLDVATTLLQLRDLPRRMSIAAAFPPEDDEHTRHVRSYNVRKTMYRYVTRTRRAEEYYQILSLPPRRLASERLLIIGPRDMHEVLLAWAYGWSWSEIEAIDLYSTNPKIRVMNMERLKFPDATFDAVAMAYTLAYASDIAVCLEGVARVMRPGAHFAFGHYHNPRGDIFPGNLVPAGELVATLRRLPFSIYYYDLSHSVHPRWGAEAMHKFGVTRIDPEHPDPDRLML